MMPPHRSRRRGTLTPDQRPRLPNGHWWLPRRLLLSALRAPRTRRRSRQRRPLRPPPFPVHRCRSPPTQYLALQWPREVLTGSCGWRWPLSFSWLSCSCCDRGRLATRPHQPPRTSCRRDRMHCRPGPPRPNRRRRRRPHLFATIGASRAVTRQRRCRELSLWSPPSCVGASRRMGEPGAASGWTTPSRLGHSSSTHVSGPRALTQWCIAGITEARCGNP